MGTPSKTQANKTEPLHFKLQLCRFIRLLPNLIAEFFYNLICLTQERATQCSLHVLCPGCDQYYC